MIAAEQRRLGFEGETTLDALLQEAGQRLRLPEVMKAILVCLEEDLLPSEVVLRVLGKEARALNPILAKRLAANLFALYDELGKAVEPTDKEKLSTQAMALREKALQAIALGQLSLETKAISHLQETSEALHLLAEELEHAPITVRRRFAAQRSLQHFTSRIEGALQVLQGRRTL